MILIILMIFLSSPFLLLIFSPVLGFICSVIFLQGDFFHWYPAKKLKYGKPRSGESTLTQIGLDTPNLALAQINFPVLRTFRGLLVKKTPCKIPDRAQLPRYDVQIVPIMMVMMTCHDNALVRSGSSKHLFWEWPLVSSDFLIPATFFYQSDFLQFFGHQFLPTF